MRDAKQGEETMPNGLVVELREKWKQRVDHQPCTHCNQAVALGQDGIVTATYYCLTCGAVTLRIYGNNPTKRLAS